MPDTRYKTSYIYYSYLSIIGCCVLNIVLLFNYQLELSSSLKIYNEPKLDFAAFDFDRNFLVFFFDNSIEFVSYIIANLIDFVGLIFGVEQQASDNNSALISATIIPYLLLFIITLFVSSSLRPIRVFIYSFVGCAIIFANIFYVTYHVNNIVVDASNKFTIAEISSYSVLFLMMFSILYFIATYYFNAKEVEEFASSEEEF